MIRPARKKVRLIHTSDTHLGDGTGHPRSEKALIAVIEAVPRLEGDALLLVGDVFDNDRIPDSVLEFFLDQIRRLLDQAVREQWLVVFDHETERPAGYLERIGQGRLELRPVDL